MSESRRILEITGADRRDFLQGLVTNDVTKLDQGLVYAALLSPQGKYLFDFFMFARADAIYLDVKADCADALAARLAMYRLRADVKLTQSALRMSRGIGKKPEGAWPDPRHPALGWRQYDRAPIPADQTDWTALRVQHIIPETGVELIANESYILEHGFERLNGVDFRKGCYVGQEVTARMKHKTSLKKGLVQVCAERPLTPGAPITNDGKEVGRLCTVSKNGALAYLRFERAGDGMEAGGVGLTIAGKP